MQRAVVASKQVFLGSPIIQQHTLVMLECGDIVQLDKDKEPAAGTMLGCGACDGRALSGLPAMADDVRQARIAVFLEV